MQRSFRTPPQALRLLRCPSCQAKQRLRLRLASLTAVRFDSQAKLGSKRQAWGNKARKSQIFDLSISTARSGSFRADWSSDKPC